MAITYEWRGRFGNREMNELHAEAFETRVFDESDWNWREQDHLRPLYFDACGFTPTNGGLIALRG